MPVDTDGMRSSLRRAAVGADLSRMLDVWSREGNTGAIAALCEQVASANVELLETVLFSLLDQDDPALAPTLAVIGAAVSRSRRSQQAAAHRG